MLFKNTKESSDNKKILDAYQKMSDNFDEFTKLMRKQIPSEKWPPRFHDNNHDQEEVFDCRETQQCVNINSKNGTKSEDPLNNLFIKRLQDIGVAQEKLKNVIDGDLFNRSNTFWESDSKKDNQKLEEVRLEINKLSNNLWDIWVVLTKDV